MNSVRNITYAWACVQSNYDAFLANATWAHKSLNTEAAREHRNGAINQREAYLDQAAIVHEEQEASRFNAIEVSMNETWERRRQRSVETSKKRGNLTAKLDQARIHQLEAQAGKRSKHKNTWLILFLIKFFIAILGSKIFNRIYINGRETKITDTFDTYYRC